MYWTEEEDWYLIENYETGTQEEMQRKLSGRTKAAIQTRVTKLRVRGMGISSRKHPFKKNSKDKKWASEEDRWLISNYGTASWPEMLRKLGRSIPAIYGRVQKLRRKGIGISRGVSRGGKWTEEEERWLTGNWVVAGWGEIQKRLRGRSKPSIHTRVAILRKKGIIISPRCTGFNRLYSEEDMQYMRQMFPDPTIPIPTIAKQLGRTEIALWNKARKLGLHRAYNRGTSVAFGSQRTNADGYVYTKISKDDPIFHERWVRARSEGSTYVTRDAIWMLQHHYVMGRHLGRDINREYEEVHHKNANKKDNRIGNLELVFINHKRGTTTLEPYGTINNLVQKVSMYEKIYGALDGLGVLS